MVYVKVCGITNVEDAQLAVELGASAIGMVFWPESPRFVDPKKAAIVRSVLPPSVLPVGVFVDQSVSYVRRVAEIIHLGAVQLHGCESYGYCQSIGLPIIKAVTVENGKMMTALSDVPETVTVLLDAHDPVKKGGTGKSIDWESARNVARSRKVILSGGLRPETVALGVRTVQPFGVDVSSGVEQYPGRKDSARLRSFFKALASVEVGLPDGSVKL
jgi:phosphoribosylanthranilate isomerase|tara:strand:- start:333 stop:980 length:648 start_codon:yes stop_codon:yes gene_type:complete